MNKTNSLTSDQRGFVSLVVAMMLIIILALMTVGFSQFSRREQKQALDKQLSIQANYAAETAINDIYQEVKAKHISNTIDPTKCIDLSTDVTPPSSFTPDINPGSGIKYTCVIVDLKPPDIQYSNLAAGSDRTTGPFTTEAALSSLTIRWGSATNKNAFAPDLNTNFLPSAEWASRGYPAVLQVSVTSLGSLSRDNLTANTMTLYLFPSVSNAPAPAGYQPSYSLGIANTTSNGQVVSGRCNLASDAKYPCRSTINGFSGAGPYLIHILGQYDDSNVLINGKDSANNPVRFVNGQVEIDATAKAQNVLKRLRVRLPIEPHGALPNYAIEAQNVCKRFNSAPYDPQYNPSGTAFDGLHASCALYP